MTKGAVYVCMSSSELDTLQRAFRAAGGKWSTFVIWAKNMAAAAAPVSPEDAVARQRFMPLPKSIFPEADVASRYDGELPRGAPAIYGGAPRPSLAGQMTSDQADHGLRWQGRR